jgi:antirestriction protein ArdC
MLWVAGRFHRYSWRNQLLLWGQAEDRGLTITRVAGYRRWAELGQQVMKGSTAFGILAPVKRRLTTQEAHELAAEGRRAFDSTGRPVMQRGSEAARQRGITRVTSSNPERATST